MAYVRRSNDLGSDQTLSAIWLIDADGTDHRALVESDAQTHTPRWSPDGRHLAYVSSQDGRSSLNVIEVDTRNNRVLTQLDTGLNNLAWSPDGKTLAWAAFVIEPGMDAADIGVTGRNSDWAGAAEVETRLGYRFDGTGNIPPGRQHLFTIEVSGGEPVRLTRDDLGASGDFAWSADGSAILFSADRRTDAGNLAPDSELHRIALADGHITTLTARTGPDTTPRPAPDGTHLAYLGFDDERMGYANVELYIADPDAGSPRSLTAGLDRSVSNPHWSADGQSLFVQYDDSGDTVIARIGLDGSHHILTRDLMGATFGRPYAGGEFDLSGTDVIAATLGSSIRPGDIAIGDAGGRFTRLTGLNEDVLAGIALSEAEEIRWASPADGREIEGWVLYPPGFDPARQWPMILEIHGGPFSTYGPAFSAELQLMAAAGYVVLYTNPRGSTSYGYEFANLIHHNYPGEDYDDLIGAVDHMIGRGFIDPDRLFVTGGSGGGVLTAWIIGNTDRFAAAAVVKPVINWASFVLYSDLPQFFYRYWFASAPWEDPQEYWRRSPLSLVGNVDTPTLMMVGGADVRTPRAETEQYYSALHLRGVPTRLVVIPDSFHGISNSRPSRLLTKVAEILRWFEEHDPGAEAGE